MAVGTRLTSKGQVTIPKGIRQRAGLKPGDEVAFSIDAGGVISLQRADAVERFHAALARIRRDPPVKGVTTDEIMAMTRGEEH